MFLFDLQEFLKVLENYNLDVWPLQILAYFLGIIVLFYTFKKTKYSNNIILIILSMYWIWIGLVFCSLYWAPTYKYAYSFGVLFIIQGIMFLIALFRNSFSIHFSLNLNSIVGLIFIFYAMIGYQVLGHFIGHEYPNFFAFGLVPCPTTIFTIGLFLLADKKIPKYFLIIPFLIAISGFVAVFNGIWEDTFLVIAGVLSIILILKKDHTKIQN